MLKTRYVYPIIFELDPDAGFGVSIPDLHAYADGNDFEEAVINARNAANAALRRLCSRGAAIPVPSSPTEIELNPDEQIYALEIDVAQYADPQEQSSSVQTITFPQRYGVSAAC